jgi:hypothetical protein
MTKSEPNRRTNDALHGGEGNPAYGDNPGDFGAGRQVSLEPLSKKNAANRRSGRDATVPRHQGTMKISGRR